jgi:hypothetical protein
MDRRFGALAGLFISVLVIIGAPGQAWARGGSRSQPSGYDVSWPQCGKTLPGTRLFAVVGVSDGLAFSDNPCLATQYSWAAGATTAPAFYLNTANPGSASVHWTTPGPRTCSGASSDPGCAYNYGWNAAAHAFAYADAQTAAAGNRAWWLDVETGNSWSSNQSLNAADVQGMLDFFSSKAVAAGIYSTAYQWSQIAGSMRPAVPSWLAGASSSTQALSWCRSASFTAGRVALVQFPNSGLDGDVACS